MLVAGENAGTLTEEGAKLLDPSGRLEAGIPLCPPEGDAGTGMVATNSVCCSAPEMYLPEHPCLPWWFWRKT